MAPLGLVLLNSIYKHSTKTVFQTLKIAGTTSVVRDANKALPKPLNSSSNNFLESKFLCHKTIWNCFSQMPKHRALLTSKNLCWKFRRHQTSRHN